MLKSKRITLIGVPERGYHDLPAETSIARFTTVTRRAERPSALPAAAIGTPPLRELLHRNIDRRAQIHSFAPPPGPPGGGGPLAGNARGPGGGGVVDHRPAAPPRAA